MPREQASSTLPHSGEIYRDTTLSNWPGMALIGISAVAGAIAASSTILIINQSIVFKDSHLEGGAAFSAFAFTNFFFFFGCLVSLAMLLLYFGVLVFRRGPRTSPHLKLSAVFLLPCLFALGVFLKGLFFR